MHLFVVSRERPGVFRALSESFQDDPGVVVVWDRRRGERRVLSRPVPAERRRGERRSRPPSTWATLGVIYVAGGHPYNPSGWDE